MVFARFVLYLGPKFGKLGVYITEKGFFYVQSDFVDHR